MAVNGSSLRDYYEINTSSPPLSAVSDNSAEITGPARQDEDDDRGGKMRVGVKCVESVLQVPF